VARLWDKQQNPNPLEVDDAVSECAPPGAFRKLISELPVSIAERNFRPGEYMDKNGQQRPMITAFESRGMSR
jgi:hypothetical protein